MSIRWAASAKSPIRKKAASSRRAGASQLTLCARHHGRYITPLALHVGGAARQRQGGRPDIQKRKGQVMRGEDLDTRRRRAAYRATHRGTKEMDWLLGRYATAVLPGLEGEALDRFERLLNMPDPELQTWLLSPQLADGSGFSDLISDLRRFHGLE